ncbi:DNA-directed DNA polymerase [Lithospermum erythrorhizon]|uniref:DNA polymerase II subunit 2 n=1 Tax=Lithospermum erythrorhizon TaxID=34254 RepID=A0AAV3RHE4_LITER
MIQKKFKTRGYALKVDALPVILSFIESYQGFHEEAICLILDELHRLSLKSSILDKEHLDEAVALVVSTLQKADRGDGIEDQVLANLQPIDAFEIPKYCYDPVKKFFYEQTRRPPIHGEASAKASLYRDRFLLLFQRLTRDPHFSAPAFDGDEHGSCEISPILSLIGQTGRRRITTGFFSENTIVLAEGEMLLNDIFQVKTCGFPPLEDRNKSLAFCAGLDLFGSGAQTKDEILRLSEDESRAVNEMFVILSDVWLDDDETMRNLEVVLDGYENVEVVPSLFVFMGNFCSRPCNLAFNSYSMLRSQFGKLGQKVAACPRLMEKSTFLFIPGPDDIGPSTALPRCPLPMYLTQEFQRHVPNSFFMSNPCR